MLLPRRLLPVFDAYSAVERAAAVAKFAQRRGWEAIDRPIFIHSPSFGQRALHLVGGGTMDIEVVTPDERARLVICADDGTPREAAVLWLTEVGHPVSSEEHTSELQSLMRLSYAVFCLQTQT